MTVLKKDLSAMTADGAAFSLMVGLGETYLPAFVLAVGLGEVAAGLIASVPIVAGAVLQLLSPWAVARLGSYRRWVVLCVLVQALSLLPLVAAAIVGYIGTVAVFMVASLYWAAGMAGGPAWNAWAGTLVPTRIRARFFACRARVCQVCLLAGTLLGGFALQWGREAAILLPIFALLFALAATGRFVSAWFLAKHSEPEPPGTAIKTVPLGDLLRRLGSTNDGRLLAYLMFAQVGVQISGPFFTPYMLRHLHFDYNGYVVMLSLALGAKIAALCFLGPIAQRLGARRLLWIGGLAITPISSLWVFGDAFYWLAGVQILSGLAWGVFELASFLVFFETVKTEERTCLMTWFNLGNALAILCGSLLGGLLLKLLGETAPAYLLLFALSTAVRACSLLLLRPIAETQPASDAPAAGDLALALLSTRTLAVRPSSGTLERPILATLPAPKRARATVRRPRAKAAR